MLIVVTQTPPARPKNADRCVQIKASPVTVGGFDVEDPQMQRAFRNQLVRHEVRRAASLVDKFAALATHEKVQESDRMLFCSLGVWLKNDLAQAYEAVKD